MSILGVLRRPAGPGDRLPTGALPTRDYSVLWVRYARQLVRVGDTRYLLIPGIVADTLPAACRSSFSAKQLRKIEQEDRQQRAGSVSLEVYDRHQGGNEGPLPLTRQDLDRGVTELTPLGLKPKVALGFGVVPDGVASVTVTGARGRRVAARVVDNFFHVRVPVDFRGGLEKFETFTVTWRDRGGAVLKVRRFKVLFAQGVIGSARAG